MTAFPDYPEFPATMSLSRATSPLVESPFQISAEDVQELFFASAETVAAGGMDIVAENNVSPTLVRQMFAFLDKNANKLYDADEKILFHYTVKIFVSRDDSYLRQAFEKTLPQQNEVCIFLEDNSTDFLSDRSAYIKIGSDFQHDLIRRTHIADIEGKRLQYVDLMGSTPEFDYQLDFTEEQIEELIKTGQIKNHAQEFLLGLVQTLNMGNILLAPLCSALGNGILWITQNTREYIKFNEHHWNPEAKQGSEGSSFTPFLFSPIINQVKDLASLGEQIVGKVSETLRHTLRDKLNEFHLQLDNLKKPSLGGYMFPAGMTIFLDDALKMIDTVVENLIGTCEATVMLFVNLGERWLNALNAFYCGLWNALIEAVLGPVDMVAYFFVILGLADDAVGAQQRIPEALELIDEAIQTILKADVPGILATCASAIGEAIGNFNLWSLTATITLEKVAYFVGGLVGWVVEIVIGWFWSGGIDGVRATLVKFGKAGEAVFESFLGGVKKLLGSTVDFTVQSMTTLVRKIIALLKQGKTEIKALIQSAFKTLEKAAVLADDVVRQIIRELRLTDEEVKWIDELGLNFVKTKDSVSNLCLISTLSSP
jgi:hypothetical protein